MFSIRNRQKLIGLYFIISFLGIVTFFIYAFFAGPKAFDWLAMENTGNFQFYDFFKLMKMSLSGSSYYTENQLVDGSQPPLAVLFVYIISKFFVNVPVESVAELESLPYILNFFLTYNIFLFVGLFISISLFGRKNTLLDFALFCSLLFSVPFFAGATEHSNMVLPTYLLILLAFYFRESPSKWKQELALLCIAVAAGLKIYPAIIGILYLKEKKFSKAFRLVIYGLLCYIIPFAFLGGFEGIKAWLFNISFSMSLDRYGRIQYIRGLVYTLQTAILGRDVHLITIISPYLFLVFMVFMVMRARDSYHEIFYLMATMMFFPTYMYRYMLIFLSVPFILHIKETWDKPLTRSRVYIYYILYALLFTIPTWFGLVTGFQLNFGLYTLTFVELYIYVIAYLILLVTLGFDILETISKRTNR